MISILERVAREETSCKVAMVMGVRDNSSHMLYKEFVEGFFLARPDSQLTVACSRDIDEQACHAAPNISYKRGYV